MRSQGVRSKSVRSQGVRSQGVRSLGVHSHGVRSQCVSSQGARSQGMRSQGVRSQGVRSQGVRSQSVRTQVLLLPNLLSHPVYKVIQIKSLSLLVHQMQFLIKPIHSLSKSWKGTSRMKMRGYYLLILESKKSKMAKDVFKNRETFYKW